MKHARVTAASRQRIEIDLVLNPNLSLPRGWAKRLRAAAAMTGEFLPKVLHFESQATVLVTSNAVVRQLNRDFRGIDKPTNVLSFPQMTPRQLLKIKPGQQPVALGDIALAYAYIVDEAKKEHKLLINHATHLVIHGLLHLFGYDHIATREAVRMERLEVAIMAALGLPDPYDIRS